MDESIWANCRFPSITTKLVQVSIGLPETETKMHLLKDPAFYVNSNYF